jgi:hypothetical protein
MGHNLGTDNVAERLTKDDLYDTWSKLGFGRPLGLIPSIENSGVLRYTKTNVFLIGLGLTMLTVTFSCHVIHQH